MRQLLRRYPFLRITLALALGIFLGYSIEIPCIQHSLGPIIVIYLGALMVSYFKILTIGWLINGLLLLNTFLLGIYLESENAIDQDPRHFSHFIKEENTCILKISSLQNQRIVAKVIQTDQRQTRGKIVLMKSRYSAQRTPAQYDLIFAKVSINEIPGPKNPKVYDYQRYQALKGIHHQAYLNSYLPLQVDQSNPLPVFIANLRNQARLRLSRIPSEHERAIAFALLLGDKRELGTDLRDVFADTGAMHVLAVSGLHIGVIYLLFGWLFRSFGKGPNDRIRRSMAVLLIIWLFALLAGAGESVVRAATMFSLFEFGKLIHRSAYPVNSLSIAAFIMLVIDPYALFNVGFQLSFSAVAGILICQKRIEQLWIIENQIGYYFWKLITVSIAAQLFTLPISLYYFHQFPIYFWLSGMVVVPLAFAVLSSGISFLLLATIPLLGDLLYHAMHSSIWIMNALVHLIQSIPYVAIESIWIDTLEFILLILMVAVFTVYLIYKRGKWMIYLTLLLIITALYSTFKIWLQLDKAVLTIYHLNGYSLVSISNGAEVHLINWDGLQDASEHYQCRNHLAGLGLDVKEWPNPAMTSLPRYFHAGPISIMVIDGNFDSPSKMHFPIDLCWITGEVKPGFLQEFRMHSDLLFIVDGSIKHTAADAYRNLLQSGGHKVHNTWDEGFYQLITHQQ